jgi:tryptophan synthase alpha chain
MTAGFPFAAITPSLMHGMVEAGADVIELGVPFSDPMADGPVIQRAGDRPSPTAWAWPRCWPWPSSARKTDHPVVLMGYANPVERYDQIHGEDAFVNDAAAAGVDGVLIVDYPPEECEEFAAKLQGPRHGPDLPAGPHQHRRAHAAGGRVASGYVYYVSLKGVTGSGALDTDGVEAMLPRIRQHVTSRSAWALASAMPRPPRPWASGRTRWSSAARSFSCSKTSRTKKSIPLTIDFLRGVRKAMDA